MPLGGLPEELTKMLLMLMMKQQKSKFVEMIAIENTHADSCLSRSINMFVTEENRIYLNGENVTNKCRLKICDIGDLETVRALSEQTFIESYGEDSSEEDMSAYIADAFSSIRMRDELLDPRRIYCVVYADDIPAGYVKINEAPVQTDINDPESIEIERLYLLRGWLRRGLGTYLLNKAVEIAVEKGKAYIWLGVWEHNDNAIAFYKSHGFEISSSHNFAIGDDIATDYIMKKRL